jgi:hypothetical protein
MNMENQGTVKVKFPRQTDTKSSWTIDPSFIARVRHSIPPDEDEWITSPEEVQAVLLALECIPAGIFTQPKREPLTDEQIEMIWTVDQTSADDCASLYYAKVIARAIEAAHGIKREA